MTSPADAEVKEDLAPALRRVLASDAVHTVLTEGALDEADPVLRDRVLEKMEVFRLGLLGQVDAIPVDEDLHQSMVLAYLELKAQWIQRQVRVCYEEMVTGSCNREVALEASAISGLMAVIEPVLDPAELVRVQEIFATMTAD